MHCILFCSFYKHTNNEVFDDFLIFNPFKTIFGRFSECCPKVIRDFPNIFRKFSKIPEDFRSFPKTSEDDPKMFRSNIVSNIIDVNNITIKLS